MRSTQWIRVLLRGFVLVATFAGLCQLHAADELGEYDVKAGFLFNFARFVLWPESAMPAASAPLVIGIVGTDPFGATLDELVQGEVVAGHPVIVRRFTKRDDYSKCHILFISRSETAHLKEIFGRLRGLPVLTVSDSERFANVGGTIGLAVDGGRVRIYINVVQAKSSQLGLSAKLLRPATLITDPPQSLVVPRQPLMQYVSELVATRASTA